MPTIVQLALVAASGKAVAFAADGDQEVVGQVRVAAAVAAALEERQVLRVLDRRGLREACGSAPAAGGHKSGTLTRWGIFGSGKPLVWITGSSSSTCCHSKLFLLPVASKLSRYCRAVSNRLRVTSATTSEPVILNVAVSTAKGLLYCLMSSSRMRPEPWQTTLSACLPRQAPGTG